MNKEIIYNLIDSLQGLARLSFAEIPGHIIDSLNLWAQPVAASAKLISPDKKTIHASVGDGGPIETLAGLEKRFHALDVSFALLSLDDSAGHMVAAAAIKSPTGHSGLILLMIKPDNPLRHHIAEILRLYADQIILSIVTRSSHAAIDIEDILLKIAPDIFRLGVDGILAINRNSLSQGWWIDPHSKLPSGFAIGEELQAVLERPQTVNDHKKAEALHGLLPVMDHFESVIWDSFLIGGNNLIVLFAGKFNDPESIFAQFRSLLAGSFIPVGYSEIAAAFKQLVDDHQQVIRGERVAAILETAVAINHEINNPLTAILGNTQLILMNKDKLSKDLLAKVTIIEKSSLRIRQVTQKLMAVVEPITTPYIDGLQMLDIDKSSEKE
jgi:hypothetical protein